MFTSIYSSGSPEIGRYLTFRDRLRRNPDERQLCDQTKRQLGTQSWANMDAAAKAKTEVIEGIIAAARADARPQ